MTRRRRLVRAVLAGLATAIVVLGMAVLIRGQWDPLERFDERVVTAATRFAATSPALIRVLLDWQWVFAASRFFVPVTAVCLLFWWRTGRAARTWWALATVLAAWGLSNVAKEAARRARPVLDHPLTNAQGYSFPSGHATTTAAMTTALVLLVWPVLRRRWMRVGAVAAAVTLTLLTALDRVLLGVHYPSDVVGGMVLGAGVVLASFLGYRGWSPAPALVPPPPAVTATTAGLRHDDGRRPTMIDADRFATDPTPPRGRDAWRDVGVRLAAPAVLLWLTVVGVGLLLTGPLAGLGAREQTMSEWFVAQRTSTFDAITLWWSGLGTTATVTGIAVLAVAVLWWRTRQWWYAIVPVLAVGAQASVFVLAALVVGRDRPDVPQLDQAPPTSSFPSGHTGAATALYVTLALAAQRIRRTWLRVVVTVVLLSLPVLVGYARLYRGMHHVSDVVVGALNGLVCALLAWHYLRRTPQVAVPPDVEPAAGTEGGRSRGALAHVSEGSP